MYRRICVGATVYLVALFLSLLQPAQAGNLLGDSVEIPSGSNVNLTASGPIDWVHWGLFSESSVDRKENVVPQISDFTSLDAATGYSYVYQFSDNSNGYSWTDGTPNEIVDNTTTGVWSYGVPAMGSGFEIAVPAGTNARVLKVFVGVFSGSGRFEASLSDGSAPDYVDLSFSNRQNGPSRCYALTFAADSSDQTLTVRWTLDGPRGIDANVTLQAATLSAAGANNPPVVMLTNPVNYASFPASPDISIGAKAWDFDGSVTNVEFFQGTTKLGESASSPYGIIWSGVPAGRYILSAVASDDGGEISRSQSVEIYVYGSGGSLTGSVALPPTTVDLTAEGTADWAHWGLTTNADFDHKAAVVQQISNFEAIGSRPVQHYGDNLTAFSWTDGTPNLAANSASNGVYIVGLTNGFRLKAPATAAPRRLNVYTGCYGAQATFQAYLSDNSAPPYTDTTTLSNFYANSYAVYTLDYTAASPGQHLIVEIRASKLFDFDFGNVTLQSATLQGGDPEPTPVTLLDPKHDGTSCIISFATQSGFNYAAQWTDLLDPLDWQTFATIPGDGSILSITNDVGTASQRFYRVQTLPP